MVMILNASQVKSLSEELGFPMHNQPASLQDLTNMGSGYHILVEHRRVEINHSYNVSDSVLRGIISHLTAY